MAVRPSQAAPGLALSPGRALSLGSSSDPALAFLLRSEGLRHPRNPSPECQAAAPGSEGLRDSGSRVGSAALFCAVT